jgi:hypothetical protein
MHFRTTFPCFFRDVALESALGEDKVEASIYRLDDRVGAGIFDIDLVGAAFGQQPVHGYRI